MPCVDNLAQFLLIALAELIVSRLLSRWLSAAAGPGRHRRELVGDLRVLQLQESIL